MGLLTVSVIIPSYNRAVVLEKALKALAQQTMSPKEYEVIVIDDGSTDDTREMIDRLDVPYSLVYAYQTRQGPAGARNHGIRLAKADLIVFIDSDIIVTGPFLQAHVAAHTDDAVIAHGAVIHTNDLDDPTSATMKVTDISRAFFATGNVSIRRNHLIEAGLFDEDFVEYGWEDLELGVRLRQRGLRAVKVPEANGYHYKPKLALRDLPMWQQRERERGRTAVVFYRKIPTFNVRMMTMISPVFFAIDRLLTLGGWPNKPGTMRFLERLETRGSHLTLRFFVRIMTFHAYMEGIREAMRWAEG